MTELGIALVVLLGALVLLGWIRRTRQTRSTVEARIPARSAAALSPATVHHHVGDLVTVQGRATVGEKGTQESGLAGLDCVWHGHEVLRHYWLAATTPSAEVEPEAAPARERHADSIADYSSEAAFALTEESHNDGTSVLVDPSEADAGQVRLCLRRLVGRGSGGARVAGDDLLNRVRGQIIGVFRGETIEFEYREWAIRPGDLLEVHGEVTVRDGHTVLVAPDGGRLRIAHVEQSDAAGSR